MQCLKKKKKISRIAPLPICDPDKDKPKRMDGWKILVKINEVNNINVYKAFSVKKPDRKGQFEVLNTSSSSCVSVIN